MAAVQSKGQVLVGSTQWIEDERKQVAVFRDQEDEDFAFSARNEVEWLNEHMAEIFSSDQLDVTDIFKTPGKLRGKTPRTARKRHPLENRAPLTNIFSTNAIANRSPSKVASLNAKLDAIQASTQNNAPNPKLTESPVKGGKGNADSGYHSMSVDDMEMGGSVQDMDVFKPVKEASEDADQMEFDASSAQHSQDRRIPDGHGHTEGSFHSAQETIAAGNVQPKTHLDAENMVKIDPLESSSQAGPLQMQMQECEPEPKSALDPGYALPVEADKDSLLEEDHESDVLPSPSDGSSPVKPLVRKSSLTFASLPAREPLTTKKSIGTRVSRTSHLDQAKAAPLNRNSYFGRYTGGKSLGGVRQPEYATEDVETEEMDLDDTDRPTLVREESDGDGRMAKLHNKSSTQRLHDRINLLGQTQLGRSTKSIAAPSLVSNQPAYPELPKVGNDETVPKTKGSPKVFPSKAFVATDDDDEWIKPPAQQSRVINKQQVANSYTVNMMKQVTTTDSTNRDGATRLSDEKNVQRQPSPSRPNKSPEGRKDSPGHQKSKSISDLKSSDRSPSHTERFHKKAISVSNPDMPSIPSTTPAGSPVRSHHDGPLNASKTKLQSIMKSARGLFTSSADVSAQAKMETLSPSSMRLRGQGHENPAGSPPKISAGPSGLSHMMYPSLQNGSQTSILSTPSKKSVFRATRSSTEKGEKRREKEAKENQRSDLELERAREQERQKAARFKEQRSASANSKASVETAGAEAAAQKVAQPIRQSPRRLQKRDDRETEDVVEPTKLPEGNELHQSMGPPPSRHQQQQPSQIQKPKELKRPVKPAKDVAPKPKPQPVAIRVGTLYPRIPLTNAALSSNLQDSLPPPLPRQPAVTKKSSNASLQASASTANFKSSTASMPSKPRALLAAERKKEQVNMVFVVFANTTDRYQDEKEAQRKLDHKREVDRKRAAQQEEAQKKEQQQRLEVERQREKDRVAAAEKRKLDQIRKDQQKDQLRTANELAHALQQEKTQAPAPAYRADLGITRPNRPNGAQDYPRLPNNFPAPNPAKPPAKRIFEPDLDDEPIRVVKVPGGQSFQQTETKRRRTEDEDTFEAPVRPTMAPPLRQSNIRKDVPKASIFSNNYTIVPSTSSSHVAGSSLVRTSAMNQPYQPHAYHSQAPRSAHPMDKYTTGKIPFAEAPNPPPPSHKTPLPSKHVMTGIPKSSPLYPNGDNIHLEDIATDSDEEDSEDEREKKRNLPDWVLTPNLDERLRDQERLNPDVLFGPVAPLVMEDIFKDKSRHHRFRSRTSSANWLGQDRLTEDEVRADNAARDRLRREGGWTFGL
ncbi:hypothetical protein MMC13_002314 [Lambiella insularis]|nr:hypothetical protein [Lambiella insularis]